MISILFIKEQADLLWHRLRARMMASPDLSASPDEEQPCLSQNPHRNRKYHAFLRQEKKTVKDLIRLGQRLMRRYGLHPHFFGNNRLPDTARFLAFYGLNGPHNATDSHDLTTCLSNEEVLQVLPLFERRIAERIPVEYLTQEAEYLGKTFYVNPHVLVPRSLMHTRFQEFLTHVTWQNKRVLDLCTGSGCIGISLALLNPEIQVDLADLSEEALKVAAVNIKKHALEGRVNCIQGDLFENIRERYDLIITNPPYVASAHYRCAPLEFKNEPRLALEAGADGLDLIKRILSEAKMHLNPTGKVIAEVGFPAAKRLKRKYPHLLLKWYTHRTPQGKTAFLAMDCIFECQAKDLPPREKSGIFTRWLRRLSAN